ncbi:MAG: UDP-N-acetylmuramate dehydrogenase [Acidaminococcales bacterium]|nr:UDP-N-acetylmuramate dehydrogenase [Acidaminococcales bacterium]
MIEEGFLTALKKTGVKYATDEPMSKHCSFRAGGPADVLAMPGDEEEIAAVAALAQNYDLPLTVLGSCTNVLVKDRGIRGVTLKIGGGPTKVLILENGMYCQAGLPLSAAAQKAAASGLAGLEFLYGIPGSVGGGVCMNAGAYGGEIKDFIVEVDSLDLAGKRSARPAAELAFGYRASAFLSGGEIITGARLRLAAGESEQIKAKMEEFLRKRQAAQPLEMPSAGSAFKRPPDNFAGKLIEQAGLCGLAVGGARVSEKHAGFIVNAAGASAADILRLMEQVAARVYKTFGVPLEPEIRIIGE